MKVQRVKERIEKSGREATLSLLSENLGASAEEIAEAIAASRNVISLTFENPDGERELQLPTESYEDEICSKLLIEDAIARLNKEEREIITLRYFGEKTQTESASILGISQVQVSRKEKKALEKLRLYMK